MRGLFLCVIMATLVSVAPAHAAEPVTLAGTNVIEAQKSGMARVRIPQDAHLRTITGDNPDLAFNGGGHFAGLYLRRLAAPVNDPQFVVAWQDDPCTASLCDEQIQLTGFPTGPDLTLPAGDYELAYIVDQGPAQVTMRLAGLDGTSTVSPHQPVKSTVGVHEGTGTGLVDDLASGDITIGQPYGLEIFDYNLRGTGPGAVEFATFDGSLLLQGAHPYGSQGAVDDHLEGTIFRGPQSYTRTVAAAGALAAPWNAKLTTVSVTLSAGTVSGQDSSASIPSRGVGRQTLRSNGRSMRLRRAP